MTTMETLALIGLILVALLCCYIELKQRQRTMSETERDNLLGGAVGVVIAGTLFTLIGVIGYQVLGWLKTGIWTKFPVSRLLGSADPMMDWKGLQKIVEFALSLHVGFLIVLIGWIVGWGLYSVLEAMTRPRSNMRDRA
jgi:hypothetical protein